MEKINSTRLFALLFVALVIVEGALWASFSHFH
jgi:hypothetical protein